LTAGQKAIAAAEACQLVDRPLRETGETFGISHEYVRMAAALIADAPDLAEQVKLGLTTAAFGACWELRKFGYLALRRRVV
jgi:hypothetical protein